MLKDDIISIKYLLINITSIVYKVIILYLIYIHFPCTIWYVIACKESYNIQWRFQFLDDHGQFQKTKTSCITFN